VYKNVSERQERIEEATELSEIKTFATIGSEIWREAKLCVTSELYKSYIIVARLSRPVKEVSRKISPSETRNFLFSFACLSPAKEMPVEKIVGSDTIGLE
jgi:hypothetical protein